MHNCFIISFVILGLSNFKIPIKIIEQFNDDNTQVKIKIKKKKNNACI